MENMYIVWKLTC